MSLGASSPTLGLAFAALAALSACTASSPALPPPPAPPAGGQNARVEASPAAPSSDAGAPAPSPSAEAPEAGTSRGERFAYLLADGVHIAVVDRPPSLVAAAEPGARQRHLVWSRDGRYLAWIAAADGEPRWTLRIHDPATKATWSAPPLVGEIEYVDCIPRGFVVLARRDPKSQAADLYVLKPSSGPPGGGLLPAPEHISATLPWRSRFTEMHAFAALDDRLIFSMPAVESSMYGGPYDFFELTLSGQSRRVGTDASDGNDGVRNLPATGGVVDLARKRYAYITGATAGRQIGTWRMVVIRSTSDFRVLASVSPPKRFGDTKDWHFNTLTSGYDGRLLASVRHERSSGESEIFEVTEKGFVETGLRGSWAASSPSGAIALVRFEGGSYALIIARKDQPESVIVKVKGEPELRWAPAP